MVTPCCFDHTGPSTPKKKRKDSSGSVGELASEEDREKQLAEALHSLQRSQAVGESGIEALHTEGEVQELDNTIVGADATIKAWRFMQVKLCPTGTPSETEKERKEKKSKEKKRPEKKRKERKVYACSHGSQ